MTNIDQDKKMHWNAGAKWLHWVMGFIMLALVTGGYYMQTIAWGDTAKQLYWLHKSFGVLILVLIGARLIWRLKKPAPALPDGTKKWEAAAAHVTHWGLYFAMFAIPLSGYVMSSAGGYPVYFFGIESFFEGNSLPALVSRDKDLAGVADFIHGTAALGLMLLLVAHIGAAIKHHVILKDNVLVRMLPVKGAGFVRAMGMGLFVAALVMTANELLSRQLQVEEAEIIDSPAVVEVVADVSVADISAVTAPAWAVNYEASSLGFSSSQMGTTFDGSFNAWMADINFDPENLAGSHFKVEIDMATAKAGGERDAQMPTVDWFNIDAHPIAFYESLSIKPADSGDNQYTAYGMLTLKGVQKPVTLNFSVEIDGDQAKASGSALIDRFEFKVGEGQWADTSMVSNEVTVTFDLEATRK